MKSWKLGSPPRRRGKDKAEHLVQDHIGITPAQAGKRCYLCASTKSSWDHPRVGGEKAKITPRLKRCRGSPPHGRGKAGCRLTAVCCGGITPAWAGKSCPESSQRRQIQDHPRMGGEKCKPAQRTAPHQGSPPHGRGKGSHAAPVVGTGGITPAWAGKSHLTGGDRVLLRITPAWAGKSPFQTWSVPHSRDHPRMGGEKSAFAMLRALVFGSPPHGRGKVGTVTAALGDLGITPAWAGKRMIMIVAERNFRDHPRMGGEKAHQCV